MASTGRKRNIHAALSALVGILQGYIGEKRRQEDRGLKERQLESEESHKWAQLQRDLQRDYATQEYRKARGAQDQREEEGRNKRAEDAAKAAAARWKEGAPGRDARTQRDIAEADKARADAAAAQEFARMIGGGQEPAPEQPAAEPAPAAPAPKKGAMSPTTQRPGTRMPTPQPQQQPLGSLTPGDAQFAGLPGMAAAPQDAQMAMDAHQAFRIVMGQEPYHPIQVAKAYVFLNSSFGTPIPGWVQQILMQSGMPMQGNGLTPTPMTQPRQPAMSGPDMAGGRGPGF